MWSLSCDTVREQLTNSIRKQWRILKSHVEKLDNQGNFCAMVCRAGPTNSAVGSERLLTARVRLCWFVPGFTLRGVRLASEQTSDNSVPQCPVLSVLPANHANVGFVEARGTGSLELVQGAINHLTGS